MEKPMLLRERPRVEIDERSIHSRKDVLSWSTIWRARSICSDEPVSVTRLASEGANVA